MSDSTRHSWRDPYTAPHTESQSCCEESHRVCDKCPVVKITVHPPEGFPFRVWQHANGSRWQGDHTPPCVAKAEVVTG